MDNQILWDNEERELSALGVDVPEWLDQDIDCGTLAAILQGGCASGAYMPAVEYHKARATMAEHGDAVIDFLEYVPNKPELGENTWSSFSCAVLSLAVEVWAQEVLDEVLVALHADEFEEEDDDEEDASED